MPSERILVFDCLRIIAIAMIVFLHAAIPTYLTVPWALMPWYAIPGPIAVGVGGFGGWGVVLIIFVSGAVLEYTYGEKIRNMNIMDFLKKRIWRIYPAYWMSLLFAVAVIPSVLAKPSIEWIRTITGFYIFFRPYLGADVWGGGAISPMGWFIGLIVSLYLLYPILTGVLRHYKLSGLAAIFFVSWLSVLATDPTNHDPMIPYWFPLSRMFIFALGIFIVQAGLYPSWKSTTLIAFWAELSFYVFLVHYTCLSIPRPYGKVSYAAIMVMCAILLYFADQKFHTIDWKGLLQKLPSLKRPLG